MASVRPDAARRSRKSVFVQLAERGFRREWKGQLRAVTDFEHVAQKLGHRAVGDQGMVNGNREVDAATQRPGAMFQYAVSVCGFGTPTRISDGMHCQRRSDAKSGNITVENLDISPLILGHRE